MSDAARNSEQPSNVFSVRLSTLSIVLLCVTVSSVASLTVVATISKADALSTVALALAVLAFAAQLIITIAQSQSSAEQTRDTFRINAETRAVLAQIQAQGNALVAVQAGQFDKVLNRAINADTVGTAISNLTDDRGNAPRGDAPDPEAIAGELRSLIEKSLEEPSQRPKTFRATRLVGPVEAKRTIDEFLTLSAEAQRLLLELSARETAETRPMLLHDSPNREAAEELHRAGLLDLRDIGEELVNGQPAQPAFVSSRGHAISEIVDPDNRIAWVKPLRKALLEAGF
jgi:hypothetical protein